MQPSLPLHIKVRPKSLEDFIGQEHILSKGKPLYKSIQENNPPSLILYGPPGTGKTTLALCLKESCHLEFVYINAATSTLEELKHRIKEAKDFFESKGVRTLLFVDEIHHFNKRQQDIFLPVLEEGYLVLVGATIHNPFFSLLSPLLSRCFVLEFKPFSEEELVKIIERAIKITNSSTKLSPPAYKAISRFSDGDARRALNIVEMAIGWAESRKKKSLSAQDIAEIVSKKVVLYDKSGDQHYDTISAFIKSIRGSDPDAAIYYLAKMLYAGEDPLYIARRLVILASEDIGNADPFSLVLANACKEAVHFLGLPEAELVLAHTVIYLACAPKSNACYRAFKEAKEDVERSPLKSIPDYLKVGNYKGAEILGHGKGYKYPHNFVDTRKVQEYVKKAKAYYRPKDVGFEKKIRQRLK